MFLKELSLSGNACLLVQSCGSTQTHACYIQSTQVKLEERVSQNSSTKQDCWSGSTSYRLGFYLSHKAVDTVEGFGWGQWKKISFLFCPAGVNGGAAAWGAVPAMRSQWRSVWSPAVPPAWEQSRDTDQYQLQRYAFTSSLTPAYSDQSSLSNIWSEAQRWSFQDLCLVLSSLKWKLKDMHENQHFYSSDLKCLWPLYPSQRRLFAKNTDGIFIYLYLSLPMGSPHVGGVECSVQRVVVEGGDPRCLILSCRS